MRILHLLGIAVWREFLQWLAWRAFLITLALNQTVTPLLGLAVWSVALPGNTSISSYYIALLTIQLMTVSYEHHTLSNGIYAGALNSQLLKPQPVIIEPLGTNIAMRIWHLLIGLPLIITASILVSVSFDVHAVLAATPALVLAGILRFLFTYLLALSAFWTQQAHGVVGFGETLIFLLGGAAAPIPLFPANIRAFGEALPFRAMLGFPAEIASAQLNTTQILTGYGWQITWIILFALLATFVWKSGVRRYTAIGG